MADKKLYVKSPFPQIEGGDPLYIDRELGKIEIGFQQIERNLNSTAVDQDARDGVSGLQTRVGTLETTQNNAVSLITQEREERIEADLQEATLRTLLQAEVNDNTAALLVEQTVRATADEAFATQITALETDYNDNKASVTQTLTTLSTATEALASSQLVLEANVELNTAGLMEERIARVTQDEALAASLTTLTANFNSNSATVNSNLLALANADSALSQSITNLNAVVSENNANIYEELDALATTDQALSTQVNTVTARVGTKARTFLQANAPIGTIINPLNEGDLWFDTDDGNKPYRYNGTSWSDIQDADIAGVAAAVSNEAIARATADSANATAIQTLATTVSGQTATVQTLSESVDGVRAKWGVTINNNGAVTGIELNSGADRKTEFKIQADKFIVAPQNGTSVVPFRVEGNVVYIEEANIKNGAITKVVSTDFPGNSGYFAGSPVNLVLSGVGFGVPILVMVNAASATWNGIETSSTAFAISTPDGSGSVVNTAMRVLVSNGSTMTFECYRTSGFPGSVVIMALQK